MIDRFFTKKNALITMGLIGLLLLAGIINLPNVKLDYDFERFFPKNDSELDFYLAHRDQFATDNDFILIALEPKGGVFQTQFLQELTSFTSGCAKLPHVDFATSITNAKSLVKTPIGWTPVPILNLQQLTGNRYLDSLRVMQDPIIENQLISPDATAVLVLIKNTNNITKAQGDALLDALDKLLSEYTFDQPRISGKVYGQRYYLQKMGFELALFVSVSLVLLAVFLFVSFRAFWTIWLPISIVGATVIVLLLFIDVSGNKLNILTTIMPTILFVVGISDVVHLLEKIIAELRLGKSKTNAIITAYKEVGLATFLTTLTTSIGFLTLIYSPIQPIGEFAMFTGVGVWIAFALTFTLFPSVLFFLPIPKQFKSDQTSFSWEKKLGWLMHRINKNKMRFAGTALLVIVVSIIGASLMEVNNYILEDLSDTDPQKMDYVYLEDKFSGVRPFDYNIQTQDHTSLFTIENIQALATIETYLTEEYGAGGLTSPLTLIRLINRGLHGGTPSYFTLPTTQKELNAIAKVIQTKPFEAFRKTVLSDDLSECRILGRIKDYGGKVFKVKNAELAAYEAKITGNTKLQFQLTGMGVLIDKNNEKLSTSMLIGLSFSFLIIGLIMALLFRNWRMIIVSLIPNVIPLVMIAGVMGFADINLKVATSIIFTIAYGIAVDDTIHLLSRFKLEMQKTTNPMKALYIAYTRTGKAVIVTTLILFSGFIALWFSSFASTYYLGVLVSLTLAFAVLADVILIPLLISFFFRKEIKAHRFMQPE